MKKILYFDMDNVLVNFQSGLDQLTEETLHEYAGQLDNVPGLFSLMDPLDGALEAYMTLSNRHDSTFSQLHHGAIYLHGVTKLLGCKSI